MAKTPTRPAVRGDSLKLSLKLDPEKVERIQRCLKKGKLTITVPRVDAISRGGNGYLYD